MSQVKTSIKCTGGGPKPPSPDPETIDILSMIPQEFETDSNIFDSDSIANQEVECVMSTQEYVLTPLDKKENVEENITPQPVKKINLFKPCGTKRKLPFNEMKHNEQTAKREERDFTRERHMVLVNCIREEHELKMKNMLEAQSFIKEEHDLQVEKLKLEILLLKSKLK
ncbi:uncharacterized protein LOC113238069 [Hyposmocoma kahamanoa]|uniref:uncharacterized protein LOC113238069 n=1 Tax=Hyposmocoma kahamanoa TaxID=1477025 RepID=UPI000E6D86B7|nr:uncharacterized protein LOC113238069 [Hyposmocoma kahamanoa]